MNQLRLFLHDLDGVLLDSKKNMQGAWGQLRKTNPGLPPFEEFFKHIGKKFPEIMQEMGFSRQAASLAEQFKRASFSRLHEYEFYPGVKDILLSLKASGKKVGVVTSKDASRTEAALRMFGFHFDVIRSGSDVTRGKPAPDDLLIAMGKAGVDPADTIYIGDMEVDCIAARRAGCFYAHAGWGYGNGLTKVSSHVLRVMKEPKDILCLI